MALHTQAYRARDFLKEHPLGTLATLSKDRVPELSVVYFFLDTDFNCFFITKTSTRKFENINNNPTGTLMVADEDSLTSVELYGTIEIVMEPTEIARIITEFQNIASVRKFDYWVPPLSQVEGNQFAVCKLKPSVMHFKNFATKLDSPDMPAQFSFTP